MKKIYFVACIAFIVGLGASFYESSAQSTPEAGPLMSLEVEFEPMADGRCTHSSDCSHGGCKSGRCGSCTHKSDCNGWGGCAGGQCGSCTHNSDCGGFGDCKNKKCTGSPYDG
ncbi:MAG: hypothetical protein AAF735_01330 [Myxococcota bacterium]